MIVNEYTIVNELIPLDHKDMLHIVLVLACNGNYTVSLMGSSNDSVVLDLVAANVIKEIAVASFYFKLKLYLL